MKMVQFIIIYAFLTIVCIVGELLSYLRGGRGNSRQLACLLSYCPDNHIVP